MDKQEQCQDTLKRSVFSRVSIIIYEVGMTLVAYIMVQYWFCESFVKFVPQCFQTSYNVTEWDQVVMYKICNTLSSLTMVALITHVHKLTVNSQNLYPE